VLCNGRSAPERATDPQKPVSFTPARPLTFKLACGDSFVEMRFCWLDIDQGVSRSFERSLLEGLWTLANQLQTR
jgi:hypothetical protein